MSNERFSPAPETAASLLRKPERSGVITTRPLGLSPCEEQTGSLLRFPEHYIYLRGEGDGERCANTVRTALASLGRYPVTTADRSGWHALSPA